MFYMIYPFVSVNRFPSKSLKGLQNFNNKQWRNMRKLMIKLRSFYIRWVKNERYKGTIGTKRMYQIYFEKELPTLQRRKRRLGRR